MENTYLETKAWPPYICGLLIGCLQLPMFLAMNRTLAVSQSISGAMSLLMVGPLAKFTPRICGKNTRISEKWQVIMKET